MQLCRTDGVGSAIFNSACINTGPSVTLFIDPTVLVDYTLWSGFDYMGEKEQMQACRVHNNKTKTKHILIHFLYLSRPTITEFIKAKHSMFLLYGINKYGFNEHVNNLTKKS